MFSLLILIPFELQKYSGKNQDILQIYEMEYGLSSFVGVFVEKYFDVSFGRPA
jgi:hypothetical protein